MQVRSITRCTCLRHEARLGAIPYELLCAMCCCDARVCDGVRIGIPQEFNFQLPQISRLRRGTRVDSHVLPALPVTGPAT
jgi:hypothetical protein